jgi:hypothetical protein
VAEGRGIRGYGRGEDKRFGTEGKEKEREGEEEEKRGRRT